MDQEERRLHVDGEQAVPTVLGRIVDAAARRQAGAVHQYVDAAEPFRHSIDEGVTVSDAGQVRRHEQCLARAGDGLGNAVTLGLVAPADCDTGRAALCQQARRRFTNALGAAGDQRNFAGEGFGYRLCHARIPVR